MRSRVKIYTIIGQDIQLPFQLTIEDIRLVCNETQKKVLCSSMLKDKVTISGNTISVDPSECVLNPNDQLTIELDLGEDAPLDAVLIELNNGKQEITNTFRPTAVGNYTIRVEFNSILIDEFTVVAE